jgi:hypothetical protein
MNRGGGACTGQSTGLILYKGFKSAELFVFLFLGVISLKICHCLKSASDELFEERPNYEQYEAPLILATSAGARNESPF